MAFKLEDDAQEGIVRGKISPKLFAEQIQEVIEKRVATGNYGSTQDWEMMEQILKDTNGCNLPNQLNDALKEPGKNSGSKTDPPQKPTP